MKVGAIIGIEADSSLEASGHRGLKGFSISLVVHALAIAVAFGGSAPLRSDSAELYSNDTVHPVERKIIWYPLREMRTLSPTQRIGTVAVAQGVEKKNLIAIHQHPKAKTGKQAILRPDAKPIEEEIPSPNLVAIETPPEPAKPRKAFQPPAAAPAPAQRVQPDIAAPVPATAPPMPTANAAAAELAAMPKVTRKFVAPPAQASAKKPDSLPPTPAPIVPQFRETGIAAPNELASMPKVTRRFVAPPAAQSSAQKPREEDIAAPAAVQTGGEMRSAQDFNQGALASVLSSGSGPPRPRFVPPPAQSGGRGNGAAKSVEGDAPPAAASVSAAVLNTAPLDKILTSIPDGARSAQISAAPAQGAPSSGPVKSNALQMANVAMSGPAPAGAPPAPAPGEASIPKRTVYEETRNSIRRNTLSAPLRPSSRIIPQAIESRFHDRVAYSMILMRPQLPVYAGDWVLWFAERSPKPGGVVQMRAPQPLRKMAAVTDAGEAGLGGRFQFAGTILKNGQLDSVVVLSGSDNADSKAAAIKDLERWEFAPALRDGEAIDVEIVLEVQFQLGNSPASPGTSRH